LVSTRRAITIAVTLAITLAWSGALATPARAAPKDPPPVGELSSGGTDRGVFEFALGSVTLGAAAALGVVGGFALATGIDKKHSCEYELEAARCQLIPRQLDFASAGLSFGLMVPLTVAGALLLRKGTRIRRDYRRFHARTASLSLSASRSGMAMSWTLRF
jgi:hypothetical protein